MEPEISRRCPACGASYRARAVFCPNCGRPTGSATFDASGLAESPEAQQEEQMRRTVGVEGLLETSPVAPAAATGEHDSAMGDGIDSPPTETAASEGQPRAVSFVEPGATTDRAHPKRHRVRAAAREAVEENLLPRVEKLRQASNVVLAEAAYDPSLRFVLIALALFFIFLVILLANNILG